MGRSSRQVVLVRDVAVATAILAAVYLLAPRTQSSLLALPYYFLVAGFDVLEAIAGAPGTYRAPIVGAYLLALAVVGTAVLHAARNTVRNSERSGIALGLAVPLAVLGALAILVALSALFGTNQREPVWTAGSAGIALLLLAGLVVRVVDRLAATTAATSDR